MRPVKVGIVGIGWWSDVLASAIRESALISVAACFSRSAEKTDAFANRFSCAPMRTLENLLAFPELDGVILTTPNSQHRAGVEAAAAAGKNIFLEKPIAHTLADGEAIIAACRRAGVVLSVGHSYRRHAAMRRLRQLIEKDELGRISLAQCVFSKDHGLRLRAEGWRSQSRELPGGCLMQIGIHHIDNLLYLLGPISEVSGMFARLETVGGIEDVATLLLRFEGGAIGQIAADYISADRFALTVYGTKALATFDLVEGLSLQRRGENAPERIPVMANDYLRDELEEFALCVHDGKPPEVDGNMSMKSLEVITAAVESATSKRVVSLAHHDNNRGGETDVRIA